MDLQVATWVIIGLFMIEFSMLFILSIGCTYASYTDIRYRKINNFCTFSLICIGTLLQLLLLLQGETTLHYFLERLLGGFIVAILMFFTSIWGAGDSKLLWGIMVMLPPSVFPRVNTGESPVLIVIVNIFVPYFLYLMVLLLLKSPMKHKLTALSEVVEALKPKEMFFSLYDSFYLLGLGSLIFMFFTHLGLQGQVSKIGVLLLIIAISQCVRKYDFKKLRRYVLSPMSIVMMFIYAPPWHFMVILFSFLVFLRFFFRPFVQGLGKGTFVTEMNIFDLQESMIPVERICLTKTEDGHIICQVVPTSIFSSRSDESDGEQVEGEIVFDVGRKSLSKEKITQLKEYASRGWFRSMDNKIKIQQHTSFAPVIYFGTLLTIICKGTFYEILL